LPGFVFDGASPHLYEAPLGIIDAVIDRYENVSDYQCRFSQSCTDRGKLEIRTMNLYFKKPSMIRIDVLHGSRPYDAGSVAVYLGDGKVVGHWGGVMKVFTLKLPVRHPLVTNLRGESIDESVMDAFIFRIPFFLERGTIEVEPGDDAHVFICTPDNESENDGITRDVVWVDTSTLLVVRSERYESETLVQEATWSGYIVNAGLPDELFDAGYNSKELKRLGIETLSRD